jgi:hypothetical protein
MPLFVLRTVLDRFRPQKQDDPQQTARDHTLPENAVGRFLQGSLQREARRIAAGHRVKFGTSCLVVARAT